MNPNNLMAIRCLRTMNFTKRAISAYLQGKSKIIKVIIYILYIHI